MAMSQKVWYDRAFVSISAAGGSEVTLQAATTSFSVSGGNFDIEGLETFGGKLTRVGPRDDIELSFDGIPSSNADFDWIFAGLTAAPAFGASGVSTSTSAQTAFRVAMLWTTQTGAAITAATTPITGTNEAYRMVWANAYCVGLEKSMDAGEHLSAKLTFKLADCDASGVQNWMAQAKDTTSGTLSALSAYTSTVKW